MCALILCVISIVIGIVLYLCITFKPEDDFKRANQNTVLKNCIRRHLKASCMEEAQVEEILENLFSQDSEAAYVPLKLIKERIRDQDDVEKIKDVSRLLKIKDTVTKYL